MEKAPKRHQLNIKTPKNDYSALGDFSAIAQHFPSNYEALKYLISLTKPPQFVEYQECEYCSEIPDEPDYINCHKPFDKQKTCKIKRKRAYCYFQCKSSSIIEVDLNQEAKKARLELEVSTPEKKKKGLIDKMPKLEPKIAGLRKEDFDLKEDQPEEKAEEKLEARPKEPNPNDPWVACPLKDSWVNKADCEKCRTTNFIAWSNCYNDRLRNPKNPIFQIKKPKPTSKV